MSRVEAELRDAPRQSAWPVRRPGYGRFVRRSPVIVIGAGLVIAVVLVALVAQIIAPYSPNSQDAQPLLRPDRRHLAGTDELGRDELSRLIYGARVSLYVGGLAVSIALAGGASTGIVAGFYGGWLDNALMRAMDILFSLPAIVPAIAITSILRPSPTNPLNA